MGLLHRLFGHIPNFTLTLEALVIALVMAALCAYVIGRLTRGLLTRALAADPAAAARATRGSVRGVRLVALVLLTAVFVPPLLELFGEPLRTGLRLKTLGEWLFNAGLQILLIATLAYAIHRALALLLERFTRQLDESNTPDSLEHAKRARTLTSLIHNMASAFIFAAAGLMILDKLNVNITPILTGAGILGLAVGFGAQTLVKDVIAGFFLILENQIRVGDSAEINGVSGLVETIHLRTVILRDVRGAVHIFPCGSIATTTNLTKDYAYAVIDVQVPIDRDHDAAIALLTQIGAELRADAPWSALVLDALEVLGIDTIGPATVTIRARIKTLPQRQWDVARELRRRVMKAFAGRGIDLRVVQKLVLEQPAVDQADAP